MPTATPTPKLVRQARRCKDPKRFPRGRPTERVYAVPVKAHIEALLENDVITGADIARAADVSPGTIAAARTRTTVQRWVAESILAVTIEAAVGARAMCDVDRSRAHLETLLQFEDCTPAAIASASGMDPRQISEVLNGVRERVHPDTERILLGLDAYVVRRNAALVSPRRAVARLRALQANGWSLHELGLRLGLTKSPYYMNWLDVQRITQEQDRKAERLFHEIGDRQGPSARAAAIAGRLGHYPPIHYDEEMRLIRESIPRPSDWIPQVTPQERARRYLRIMGLTLREYTATEIAKMMKVHPKLIERARKETGLRLNANRTALLDLPYVRTGQDELVAAITAATAGINLLEEADVMDTYDTDHVALWAALLADAERIRSQAAPQTAQTAA